MKLRVRGEKIISHIKTKKKKYMTGVKSEWKAWHTPFFT